jgi:eukaryotic-like serine/threonine-protein kinase
MGSVWHAYDERQNREVALKIVPRTGTAGPRAEREAAAAAQLRHPACLRAYALARDEEHVYIAYKYVPGRTLRQALERGELDDVAAVEVAAQILEGLAHAHERGIVHRDVKPANVLLADGVELSAMLLDFGLALVTEEETLTAAGDVPGTLAYISPERLSGKAAGPATDVWSVGVLLWEVLAGRHPFGGGPFLEVAKRIARGAPSLTTARPDLPKAFAALVDRALAAEPEKRPSASTLAAALRRAPTTRPRRIRLTLRVPRGAGVLVTVGPPALLAGWTSATLPFFPAYWPGGLAVAAALLSLVGPRLGLAFALAVPVLPLGNISLGLAILYGLFACAWFTLFWGRPRAALLFLAGPLLAPFGAVGLLPLVTLPAGAAARRAAQTVAAVLSAAVVAGIAGHNLPFAGSGSPDLPLAGLDSPFAAGSTLFRIVAGAHGLLPETLALAGAAAAIGACRRRGPWGGAAFGALIGAATLLADPGTAALPLVAAAWMSALLLALEPGPIQPAPQFFALLRRISAVRPRLSPAAER